MSVSRQETSRYDPSRRRRAQRAGREKGIRLYIAATELRAAGFDPDEPPPFYRVWSGDGSVFVRLYLTDEPGADQTPSN